MRADVADLTDADFGAATIGMTSEEVLRAVGQPSSRAGGEFHYCLTGPRNGLVSFDATGHVTTINIT